ncbi:MAG TPA: hypothetical protein VM925_18110 [Labilithrix sp.]|jgi:hypothetical protein|nr:hypothetical protein [Labilithrix sp.]
MGTSTWQPKWWTKEHGSSWERVKEAMKRDWEQTKNDLHMGGRDLDQDVDDTVKQATGKDVIPPRSQPNAPGGTDAKSVSGRGNLSWDDAEVPLAYGYGARQNYGSQHNEWDDRLEGTLKSEWESSSTGGMHRKWDEVKNLVRRGYDRARH